MAAVGSQPLLAQGTAEAVTLTVTAGYDGWYKDRRWLPVTLRVSNRGPAVEGLVTVTLDAASGSGQVQYQTPLSLPTQSDKVVRLYVYADLFLTELTVHLYDDRGRDIIPPVVTPPLRRLEATDWLYAVVSDAPPPLTFLQEITAGRPAAGIAFLNLDDLPEQAAGWNTLDVLILTQTDSSRLTPAQQQGLRQWIATGGQLVITGGLQASAASAGLTDLLPVTLETNVSVDDLPTLRLPDETGAAAPAFRDPGPYLLTTSRLQVGEVLLSADGSPLLARRSWGQGAVFFLALDPALAPLRDWEGAPAVWQRLADTYPSPALWPTAEFLSPYYVRSAVESLPTLALPTGLNLFLFLLIYVATIGPANYLVLRQLGRAQWGWVTTPAITLFFVLLAYITGFQLKGNDLIVNQMSVAYGSAVTGELRVESVVGLYAPRRATYDMTVAGDVLLHPLNDRPTNQTQRFIQRGSSNQLAQLRVDVGAVEAAVASTYVSDIRLSGQVRQVRQHTTGLGLEVDLRNDTGRQLQDVVLLVGASVLPLGSWAPGERYVDTPTLALPAAAPSGSVGRGPLTVPGVPGSAIPALESLVGSGSIYDDPRTYARWQLLQALASNPYATYGAQEVLSGLTDGVLLVAWAEPPLLEVSLEGEAFETSGETLYFLHIPLTSNIDWSAGPVEIDLTWQQWRVLADNVGFSGYSLQNFNLSPGWLELEYRLGLNLTTFPLSELRIALAGTASQPPPHLALWHWEEERWDSLPASDWGTQRVADPTPYVGEGQTVRLRLENDASDPVTIQRVHPLWVIAPP